MKLVETEAAENTRFAAWPPCLNLHQMLCTSTSIALLLCKGEFAKEMKNQKGMPVDVLVSKAIAGIDAGKTEIRPGLSNVLT